MYTTNTTKKSYSSKPEKDIPENKQNYYSIDKNPTFLDHLMQEYLLRKLQTKKAETKTQT